MGLRALNPAQLFLDEKRRHETAVMDVFKRIVSVENCEMTPFACRYAAEKALGFVDDASDDFGGETLRTVAEILSMCVDGNDERERFRSVLSRFVSVAVDDADSEGDERLVGAGTLFGCLVGLELPLTTRAGGWRGMARIFDECAHDVVERDSRASSPPLARVFFDSARDFLASSPSFASDFSSSKLSKAGTWEYAFLEWAGHAEGLSLSAALLLEGDKQREFLEDISMLLPAKEGRPEFSSRPAPPTVMKNSDTKRSILCILGSAANMSERAKTGLAAYVAGEGAFATFVSDGVLDVPDIPGIDAHMREAGLCISENSGDATGWGDVFEWRMEFFGASRSGEPFLELLLRRVEHIDADMACALLDTGFFRTLEKFVETGREAESLGNADGATRERVRAAEGIVSTVAAKIAERDEEYSEDAGTPIL